MEFFAGAKEIGEAEVDDGVIDQGLQLIRKLWDAGVAHRDIKPANLMVRDGQVLLIDAFFVQVRPSPWRQAVDLGNMLLVLALRSDPDRVYEHALQVFSPEELSEAVAATHSVASPTQVRSMMKKDGRDLMQRFRELAPPHARIVLQRWSIRRVVLGLAMFVTILVLALGAAVAFLPSYVGTEVEVTEAPECGINDAMILMAQAVPTATQLPCIRGLPSGWHWGNAVFRTGHAEFWLHEAQGVTAAVVVLSPSCAPNASARVTIPGGCVAVRLQTIQAGPAVRSAIGFMPRSDLVAFVDQEEGLALCGAGSSCPG